MSKVTFFFLLYIAHVIAVDVCETSSIADRTRSAEYLRGAFVHLEGSSTTRQIAAYLTADYFACTFVELPERAPYIGEREDRCQQDNRWQQSRDIHWLALCREADLFMLAKCENNTFISYAWRNFIYSESDEAHFAEIMHISKTLVGRLPTHVVIENSALHELDDTDKPSYFKVDDEVPLPLVWRIIERTRMLIEFIQRSYLMHNIPVYVKTSNEYCGDARRSSISFINNVTSALVLDAHLPVIDVFRLTAGVERCAQPLALDRWHHYEYKLEIFEHVFFCMKKQRAHALYQTRRRSRFAYVSNW